MLPRHRAPARSNVATTSTWNVCGIRSSATARRQLEAGRAQQRARRAPASADRTTRRRCAAARAPRPPGAPCPRRRAADRARRCRRRPAGGRSDQAASGTLRAPRAIAAGSPSDAATDVAPARTRWRVRLPLPGVELEHDARRRTDRFDHGRDQGRVAGAPDLREAVRRNAQRRRSRLRDVDVRAARASAFPPATARRRRPRRDGRSRAARAPRWSGRPGRR